MSRFVPIVVFLSVVAVAQPATPAKEAPKEKKEAKDTELKKKTADVVPDKSLAGDVTRKKEKRENVPTLQYDQFRTAVESQVAAKRAEQITDLKKIIELTQDEKEKPGLLFRLGELYWEESKHYFFEANRKDDDKIKAMNAGDKAGQERAEAEKNEILAKSKEQAQLAVEQYSKIVQNYKGFERTDEVLYFLGLNLIDMGDEKRGLLAYKRLIDKFQKSRYLPDAYLAVGEYYFNNSKGKRDFLEKALDNYKNAAKFTDNTVYGYAMYKQGWCYFNMNEFEKAMDQFKSVVLYAKIAGDKEVEGGKANKQGLAKEARTDYVRAFARGGGGPNEGKERFSKLADNPDDLRVMLKGLANLYYEDGKDKEAALGYLMLINDRPTSPEAPGFQGKIVDCVMRQGNKRQTVQQVRRLVKIMDDVVKGNPSLPDKDKKSLDEARELSERTISNLAVNWHNEARKTRDDETYGFANEVYADYLTLFPESPKAYDLRFFYAELLNDNLNKYDRSAEEYTKVMLADVAKVEKGEKPGKWMNNASYNSILAWDEVVKKADLKLPEAALDCSKKGEIPPAKKGLLDACERYLKYVDKGEKKVEIAYKVAKIYYDYNWLDEATARFADIALKHPEHKFENGDRVGEIAANLVLDSYNLCADWPKVLDWAKKFRAEEKLAVGKFRADLDELIEKTTFKLINGLEARHEYAKSGEEYLKFVADYPKSELIDKALFNASIDFYNAKMLDKAIEVRKTIVKTRPRSPYLPQTMFALAEGYEALTDFDNSADLYELYAANFEKSKAKKPPPPPARKAAKGKDKDEDKKAAAPVGEQVWDESKAQDALFNAAIFRDGLGQFKTALRDREKYLELWPETKETEAVTKSIIDLHEKMSAWKKVVDKLEEYERKYVKDPNKVLTAEGRIATVYEEKLRNAREAQRIYKRILDYYEKLPKKQREALEILALDAVGRASFVGTEDDWKKYSTVKLHWTRIQNPGELKASIKTKAESLKALQALYTKTVSYKSAEPAICALHKLGMAYDQFAEMLCDPPIPKGVPDDVKIEVKLQICEGDEVREIKKNATEAFASAVQKSGQLDVFNKCSIAALDMLRNKYRPEQFPKMGEDVLELKLPESKSLSVGADVLTAVQPVPVVASEKVADLRAKAREVNAAEKDDSPRENDPTPVAPPPRAKEKEGRDTASNQATPASSGSSTKTAAPAPKPDAKATDSGAPTATKKPKRDDEPEEPL